MRSNARLSVRISNVKNQPGTQEVIYAPERTILVLKNVNSKKNVSFHVSRYSDMMKLRNTTAIANTNAKINVTIVTKSVPNHNLMSTKFTFAIRIKNVSSNVYFARNFVPQNTMIMTLNSIQWKFASKKIPSRNSGGNLICVQVTTTA